MMIWIWIAVIVCACFFEWLTQLQLVSIWAALGGLVALVLELCGVDFNIQIIVFFLITLIAIALTRPLAKKLMKFDSTPTNSDMNIGKIGKVVKIVDGDMGIMRVKVENEDWSAVTENKSVLPLGTDILVKKIEGAKLIIEPVKQKQPTMK